MIIVSNEFLNYLKAYIVEALTERLSPLEIKNLMVKRSLNRLSCFL